jgi:hypothetical protein
MAKYAARGIELAISSSTVGQMTSLAEVGSSRDLIDASAYGDDWKDYVLGQQDGTEVAGVCAYDAADSGQMKIIAAYEAGTVWPFSLTHTDAGVSLDFDALVTTCTRGGDLGGLLQLSFTLKIVNPGVSGS